MYKGMSNYYAGEYTRLIFLRNFWLQSINWGLKKRARGYDQGALSLGEDLNCIILTMIWFKK